MDAIDIDLSQLEAQDEAELVIRHPKTREPTTWVWTFYGPGHARTQEIADRASRRLLKQLAEQREARANGREWVDEEKRTPEQNRAQTIADIVARTKSFTPVKLGDTVISFSAEAATQLLSDRKKDWLLEQVINFLKAEENFIQPSATS
ncbi:branched-chain amino acid ABC transporter [Bradyrhizobium sp. HKCCYLR1023]|uniref:branched-chain amino acid ABC transporter n=1 Tax=Bradyrhizobium TaxID=374 RepID=UPI003EB8EE46